MQFVLFHAGCMDGFAAAYTAWTKFGNDETVYIPVQYGQPVPDLPNAENVFIVDFSYGAEVLCGLALQLESKGHRLVVLDHHKSAKEDLENLNLGKSAIYFDMNRSGAVMAWEFFHPGEQLPNLLRYVQDRDLWKWELPDSKAVSAYLQTEIDFKDLNKAFRDFDLLCESSIYNIKEQGRIILKYQDKLIQQCLAHKHQQTFQTVQEGIEYIHQIWSVNSPVLQSEIGNELAKEHGMGDVYYNVWDAVQVKMVARHSLRSIGDIDVSVIAKSLGGGGHKHAAGFSSTILA